MDTCNYATGEIPEKAAGTLGRKWLKAVVMTAAAAATLTCGCTKNRNGEGELRLKFPEQNISRAKGMLELPDTNDFLLEIRGSDGKEIYKGAYGRAPEVLNVPAGNCSVSIRSEEFQTPSFDRPQFGDDQIVVVPAGGSVCAIMECRQTNAGVRLKISPDFITAYPEGVMSLKSDKGKLIYYYRETRYAYFLPGNVSLVLTKGTKETILLTRKLEASDMLTIDIKVSDKEVQEKSGIEVQIDTFRVWLCEDYTIGEKEEDKGSSDKDAMSVSQAKESVGMKDVWVTGYIVGGDMTSGAEGISFTGPFEKPSHLAIASRASVSSKASCIAVELPDGDIRDAINLTDNPELLGRRISLKGNIEEKYLGITGLKEISDFVLY